MGRVGAQIPGAKSANGPQEANTDSGGARPGEAPKSPRKIASKGSRRSGCEEARRAATASPAQRQSRKKPRRPRSSRKTKMLRRCHPARRGRQPTSPRLIQSSPHRRSRHRLISPRPTLLASALPDHAAASPPGAVATTTRRRPRRSKPAPAMEATRRHRSPGACARTTDGGAPAPAAGGEPVQLATNVDEPNKSAPAPAGATAGTARSRPEKPTGTTPQPAAPVSEPRRHTDTKPKDATTLPEPKSAQNPTDSSKSDSIKSDSVAPSASSLVAPDVPKNDAVKPDLARAGARQDRGVGTRQPGSG